jgi:hypothetical protein
LLLCERKNLAEPLNEILAPSHRCDGEIFKDQLITGFFTFPLSRQRACQFAASWGHLTAFFCKVMGPRQLQEDTSTPHTRSMVVCLLLPPDEPGRTAAAMSSRRHGKGWSPLTRRSRAAFARNVTSSRSHPGDILRAPATSWPGLPIFD